MAAPRLGGRQPKDLWVTSGRAQSLAYALRQAGARSVVIVALGRKLNQDYAPAARIVEQIKRERFDLEMNALDGLMRA